MPQLSRIRQYSTKQEAAEGTAETPAAADVPDEVEELAGTYTNEMNPRNPLRATLSRAKSIPGQGVGTITGKLELKAGGGAAIVPPCKKILLASALGELVVNRVDLTAAPAGTFRPGERATAAGGKVIRFIKMLDVDTMLYAVVAGAAFVNGDVITGSKSAATATVAVTPGVTAMGFAYKPVDPDSSPSFTDIANHDGVRRLVFGNRKNFQLSVEGAGKLAYLNFTAEGKATKPIDAVLFSGVTLPTVLPESFLLGQVSAGNDLLTVDGFSFDLANTLARRPSANDATGIISYRITDRKPTITIAPEAGLESAKDFFNEYDTGVEFGFFAQIGQTATQRIALAAPNAIWSGLPSGDRDGIETYEATLELNGSESDGDDEFILAFF